jgi:hypothetical protein
MQNMAVFCALTGLSCQTSCQSEKRQSWIIAQRVDCFQSHVTTLCWSSRFFFDDDGGKTQAKADMYSHVLSVILCDL